MISVARIRELLVYDEHTGIFTWRVGRRSASKGALAGTKRPDGYIKISLDRTQCLAHRVAWAYTTGTWPGQELDHRNRDPSDNRMCNLRLASRSQNRANQTMAKRNTSGLKGVSWSRAGRGWMAQIMKDNKHFYLGIFETKEKAHSAYAAATVNLNGEFGRAA